MEQQIKDKIQALVDKFDYETIYKIVLCLNFGSYDKKDKARAFEQLKKTAKDMLEAAYKDGRGTEYSDFASVFSGGIKGRYFPKQDRFELEFIPVYVESRYI